jgi:hypothetical protein
MTNQDKIFVSSYLIKRAFEPASLLGGDTGFEHAMGALSFVPGVGFLGNLGQGASQLIRGHPWQALGSAALGAGSLFTGGLANDAVKGIGAASRIGKALPTFSKGVGMLNKVPKAVMGMGALKSPSFQSFARKYPSNWVSGGQSLQGPKNFAKNFVGSNVVTGAANHLDSAGSTARDNVFNSTMNFADKTPSFMGGGMSGDPRYLAPQPIPAPFEPMFGHS